MLVAATTKRYGAYIGVGTRVLSVEAATFRHRHTVAAAQTHKNGTCTTSCYSYSVTELTSRESWPTSSREWGRGHRIRASRWSCPFVTSAASISVLAVSHSNFSGSWYDIDVECSLIACVAATCRDRAAADVAQQRRYRCETAAEVSAKAFGLWPLANSVPISASPTPQSSGPHLGEPPSSEAAGLLQADTL